MPTPYVKPDDVTAILHLCCKNDSNGNPNRGYLIIGRDGWPVGYVDEGYRGEGALSLVVDGWDSPGVGRWGRDEEGGYLDRTMPRALTIPTTPGTLREWRAKKWES